MWYAYCCLSLSKSGVMMELMHLLAQMDVSAYQEEALACFPDVCRSRPRDSHKGTFGTVGVIGGSRGMTGAALLAATSAIYGGCGKVLVGLNQENPMMASAQAHLELMIDDASSIIKRYVGKVDVWVAGCGLADDEESIVIVQQVWQDDQVLLVLDAGALVILAKYPDLLMLNRNKANLVLTPHPGEMAVLLDASVSCIQNNRVGAAKELAKRYHAWVVLKGYQTVIVSPKGAYWINHTGNAGLATAGSGDVLAGLVGSLLAQGVGIEQAVVAAVWMHGVAADLLVKIGVGPMGMLAGELPIMVRWLRNKIVV